MHMLTHMHMPCPAVYLFLKLYDLEKYSGTDDILNWVWEAWARGLYLIAVLCRLATLISLGLVGSARLDARLATTERQLPTALEAVFAASHPGLPPTPEAIEAVSIVMHGHYLQLHTQHGVVHRQKRPAVFMQVGSHPDGASGCQTRSPLDIPRPPPASDHIV